MKFGYIVFIIQHDSAVLCSQQPAEPPCAHRKAST